VKQRLLLITDGWDADTARRVEAALAALPAGLAAVQLRAKALSGRALHDAALVLRTITAAHGAPLLVNDRIDVARAAGADGAHLPANGLPTKAARRAAAGDGFLLGASTHSLDELRMAGAVDYVVFGPVFAAAGKGPPVGIAALGEAVRAARVPVFALGGVDAVRAAECVRAGARVACIGAVLGAADPAAGARAMAAALERA